MTARPGAGTTTTTPSSWPARDPTLNRSYTRRMSNGFGTIAIFALVAVAIPGGTLGLALGLNRVLGVRRPNPAKDDAYESGMSTIGPTWVQFRVQYYLYALLFVLFDVEVLFVVPWAVAYRGLDRGYAFVEMALFLLLLVVGLLWAWRRGALQWE